MDSLFLVAGGVDGLVRIAEAFRSRGLEVSGIYLIKRTGYEDDEKWIIRLISDQKSPDLNGQMIKALVSLERDRALPLIDPLVRVHIAPSDDPEAARVIDYTHRLGGAPAIIRDVMWQGLFIEYAVVALVPERDAAAA